VGGDGRDPDAVAIEVVGEERSEAALRLQVGFGQLISSRDGDWPTDLVSIWQLTAVGKILVWPRDKLRPS
jgi:hypothetical protein